MIIKRGTIRAVSISSAFQSTAATIAEADQRNDSCADSLLDYEATCYPRQRIYTSAIDGTLNTRSEIVLILLHGPNNTLKRWETFLPIQDIAEGWHLKFFCRPADRHSADTVKKLMDQGRNRRHRAC